MAQRTACKEPVEEAEVVVVQQAGAAKAVQRASAGACPIKHEAVLAELLNVLRHNVAGREEHCATHTSEAEVKVLQSRALYRQR